MVRKEFDEMIAFLDSLAKLDPVAMGALIEHRVSCNPQLSEHPTVQVSTDGGKVTVGLLGIINGYIGTIEEEGRYKGWGIVAAIIERDGRCTGFQRTDEPQPKGSGAVVCFSNHRSKKL